jgi:hypothetical protein
MSVIPACGLRLKEPILLVIPRKRLERAMTPIVKTLLRRFLLTLSGIAVWAKALTGRSADEQTRSTPETDQKTAGGRQQKPNREP